jgi:hypothetical protein
MSQQCCKSVLIESGPIGRWLILIEEEKCCSCLFLLHFFLNREPGSRRSFQCSIKNIQLLKSWNFFFFSRGTFCIFLQKNPDPQDWQKYWLKFDCLGCKMCVLVLIAVSRAGGMSLVLPTWTPRHKDNPKFATATEYFTGGHQKIFQFSCRLFFCLIYNRSFCSNVFPVLSSGRRLSLINQWGQSKVWHSHRVGTSQVGTRKFFSFHVVFSAFRFG